MPSCIVRNYSGRIVAKGGTVHVYGAGFTSSTKSWFGSSLAHVMSRDDGSIELMAPASADSYTLYVGDASDDKVAVGSVKVVNDVSALPIDTPVEHDVVSLRDSMLGLMPRGFAWYRGTDGVFAKLFLGLAPVVKEIYRLAILFRKESSPAHTTSLDEWENELSLPEDGVVYSGTASEIETQRRSEIFRKDCRRGGATKSFFRSIAALFGIDCEIYEYCKDPEQFESVGGTADEKYFYWMIRMTSGIPEVTVLRAGNTAGNARAGMRLRSWGNPYFVKMIESLKPAHTKCLYASTAEDEEE